MKKIKSQKGSRPSLSTEFQARIPICLIYIFFIFWVYIVAKNYYSRNPVHLGFLAHIFSLAYYSNLPNPNYLNVLMNHFMRMIFLLLILCAGYGLGAKLSKLFKIAEKTSLLEHFLFSIGLGLGGIILFVFGIGILGLLYKGIVLLFLVIFSCFGLYETVKKKLWLLGSRNRFAWFEVLLVIILLLASLIFLIGALSPDTYYDSMVYYLSVPQHWIQHHRIITLPYNTLSHMMFNISLLYTVGLMLKDEILAKLINFSLGILTIFTIYVFCRKYFNRQIGLLAMGIFYTIPVTAIVSQRAGIELGLAFFETLAVFAFINWCQQTRELANQPQPKADSPPAETNKQINQQTIVKKKWLIVSAIFTGLAVGGKYISGFSAFGLFLSIFFKTLFFDKGKFSHALRNTFLFALFSIIVFSPWVIKNLINIGSPIYHPSFANFIKYPNARYVFSFVAEPTSGLKLRSIFLLPWTVTMGIETQEPFPGPVFLLVLPFLFLFGKLDKLTKYLLFYFSILYLIWALIACYVRYFLPSLPVISVILAVYILKANLPQIFKKVILLVISLAFLGNIYFILLMQKINQNPLPVVLGLESRKEYLSTQRPTYPNPYYGVIDWANQNLPETAKILFMGEARELYAEKRTITGWIDTYTPAVVFSRSAKNGDELWGKLKKEGITHILLNVPEVRRLTDILHWEGEDLKVFLEFWNKYVKEIYKDVADISIPHQGIYSMKKQVPHWWKQYHMDPRNYVYLYEILLPEEAEKPHPVPLNFFLMPELYSPQKWEKIKKYFNLS